jgi:hypothetical protein
MSLIIPANTLASGGYEVANSLRFNEVGSNNSLTKTFGSSGNQKTMTYSFWVKRSIVAEDFNGGGLVSCGTADGDEWNFTFRSNVLDIRWEMTNGSQGDIRTSRKFRDLSAWYHVVLALDTTQSTASNRIRFYVNGVEETSFAEAAYPDQNLDFKINGTVAMELGRFIRSDKSLVGYLAEFIFIDGQALDPTSFGEFDEDSGIWKPIDVSGLTFGTNGFYLDFEDSGALGDDVSGNGNDWTPNNLAAIDQSTDTCTNNFATLMHPGYDDAGNVWQNILSEGNLFGASTSGGYSNYIGTIGLSTGKWYWETKVTLSAATNANSGTGIKSAEYTQRSAWQSGSGSYYFSTTGDIGNATTPGTSYGSAISSGNIVGVAYDATNGVIWFSINGTWQNSATISEIEAGTTTNAAFSSIASGTYLPFGTDATGSRTFDYGFNFGSPFYAISSGNTDGNGYGNFEYAVPSGYYALNTKNLAEYG